MYGIINTIMSVNIYFCLVYDTRPCAFSEKRIMTLFLYHSDGLAQDYSKSSALAMELLQSSSKPLSLVLTTMGLSCEYIEDRLPLLSN